MTAPIAGDHHTTKRLVQAVIIKPQIAADKRRLDLRLSAAICGFILSFTKSGLAQFRRPWRAVSREHAAG
jgi:L-asparaginase II